MKGTCFVESQFVLLKIVVLLGVSFLSGVLVSFFGCYPRECGLYEASDGPHGPQAPGPVIGSDDEHLKWARPLTNCAQEKINA